MLQASIRLLGSLALVSLGLAATLTKPIERRMNATNPCLHPYSIEDVENMRKDWDHKVRFLTMGVFNGSQCCELCHGWESCYMAQYAKQGTATAQPFTCVLAINQQRLEGDDITFTDMCPLGIDTSGDIDNVEGHWDKGFIPGPCWNPGW